LGSASALQLEKVSVVAWLGGRCSEREHGRLAKFSKANDEMAFEGVLVQLQAQDDGDVDRTAAVGNACKARTAFGSHSSKRHRGENNTRTISTPQLAADDLLKLEKLIISLVERTAFYFDAQWMWNTSRNKGPPRLRSRRTLYANGEHGEQSSALLGFSRARSVMHEATCSPFLARSGEGGQKKVRHFEAMSEAVYAATTGMWARVRWRRQDEATILLGSRLMLNGCETTVVND